MLKYQTSPNFAERRRTEKFPAARYSAAPAPASPWRAFSGVMGRLRT